MSSTSKIIRLNCVVFGDDLYKVFSIKIAQNENVLSLKELVLEKQKRRLDGLDASVIQLFDVNTPGSLNLDNFTAGIRYAISNKRPLALTCRLDSIFSPELLEQEIVHIVVLPPRDAQEKIIWTLEDKYPYLFELFQVRVSALGSWSREDVYNNGGRILIPGDDRPPRIATIEARLAQRRTYAPLQSPDTGGSGFRMAREKYSTFFQQMYLESDGPFVSVKEDREFVAFFNVLECFQRDSARISADKSSALKATQFMAHLLCPPFFSCDDFKYEEQAPSFPIFLCRVGQPTTWCRYNQTSNFMFVSASSNYPLVTTEVISGVDQSNRERLLLQAVASARVGQYLIKTGETFFVVAIYLHANMTAERYIVAQAEEPDKKVYLCRKDFNLCNPSDSVSFLREMYNGATMLAELAGKFDPEKMASLNDIEKRARGLHSLTEITKTNKEANNSERSYSDESEASEAFDAEDVQAILRKLGCEIEMIPFGHPLIAMVSNTVDNSTGFLKFVRNVHKEIPILQYLSGLDSPRNHTISGIRIWPVSGGKVISMPSAGSWLTSLRDPDAHLWSAASQLFEAVDFMHQHGVAHLDLKPANVLIPPNGGRLSIIDFHTSIRIEGTKTTLCQSVGTPEYMPPEVAADHGLFSALRADLWSCGKTLSELCHCCSPSPDRELLLQIAGALMDRDPEKRPMMSNVLQRMADYKGTGDTEMDG